MVLKSSSALISLELEFSVAQHKSNATKALYQTLDARWACDPPTATEPRYLTETKLGPSPWLDSEFVLKLCETIASRGLPAACRHPLPPFHPRRAAIDKIRTGSILRVEGNEEFRVWNRPSSFFRSRPPSRFDYWVVTRDDYRCNGTECQLIEAPRNYNWFPVRLKSPLFCSKEVDNDLPRLRQALGVLQDNLKLCINSSCGLHVHIREEGQTLDLDVIKRVVSLVYLLEEPLLVHLFHPHRAVSGSAWLISIGSQLAKDQRYSAKELSEEGALHLSEIQSLRARLKGRSSKCDKLISALHRIWAEPTITSLQSALQADNSPPYRCGLHISDIHTLEFLYPESSFDADFICRWARLALHIFSVAQRPADQFGDTLYRVYELVTRPEMPSWPAVSAAVGVPVHPDRWQERIRRYKADLRDLEKAVLVPKGGANGLKRMD